MKLSVFVVGIIVASSLDAQVAIPRFKGTIPGDEARYIRGMHYTPDDRAIRWLPNGQLVLMHLEQYNSADVYGSTCGGSGLYSADTKRRVAPQALAVGRPSCEAAIGRDGATVDPLGQFLVYSVRVEPNGSQLVRFRISDGRLDTVRAGCAIYHEHPAFSADGQLIATDGMCRNRDGSYEVYLMKTDGTGLRRIGTADTASHESPSWSPDAERLVYMRHSGPLERPTNEIVVVDSAGRRASVLAHGLLPSWSPTESIAFLAPDGDRRNEYEIRVIQPNGSGERVVFRNKVKSTFSRGWGPMSEGKIWGPLVWSPDGQELAFTRAYDLGSVIWVVNVITGAARQLTAPSK
jgi:Tol biopolymer transport system component